jgi:hypothetical protein
MTAIEITRFEPFHHYSEFATTVAGFDVTIGDITIRKASLRYRNDTHAYCLGFPDRMAGVTVLDPSPTREAILEAAMARFRAVDDVSTLERGREGSDSADPAGTGGPAS